MGGGERVILKSRRDWDCWGIGSLGSGGTGGSPDERPDPGVPVEEPTAAPAEGTDRGGTELGGTELGLALSGFLSNIFSRAVSHFIKVGKATLK